MRITAGLSGTLALLLIGGLTYGHSAGLVAAPLTTSQAVVVAELFTSEGCSSCPPADEVLMQLVQRQPVHGVRVVALGEHVDYWDRLGWRDRFSSAALTARQSEYASRVFRTSSVYTPQLVVDGRYERVGSDAPAIQRAIKEAAQAPKAIVDVTPTPTGATAVHVDVHVTVPSELAHHETADVLVAVTEDNLVSDVRHGENQGRMLRHSAVVRSLTAVGVVTPQDHTFATMASVPLAADWKTENVRVIGFVQERQSRRIIGAGISSLRGPNDPQPDGSMTPRPEPSK